MPPRSWSPQSQRRLASRSPVKHSECSRTKTGADGSGEPIRIARCSRPPSRGRNAIRRAFSASASGTRASATRSSPAVAASRLKTAAASMTARSPRRAKNVASLLPTRRTSAAGNSEASFAKATAARAPPLAGSGLEPKPGGSAPSDAPGSARLRITAAGNSSETEIVKAPDNSSRAARPSATARRRVRTTRAGAREISRSRRRFSSLASSAATARTLISSSRISTGSPRRIAVMDSPRDGCAVVLDSSTLFSSRPPSYGVPRLAPATLFDLTYAGECTAE